MTTNVQMSYVINLFSATAKEISKNKIFYHRDRVKALDIPNQLHSLAGNFLGADKERLLQLESEVDVRDYLLKNFGVRSFRYFEDESCEIILDHEHALFFYYALLAKNSPLAPKALGLAYFLAGHSLDSELSLLHKNAPKDLISPTFRYSTKIFDWARCPYVLRRYMLDFSVPENHTPYVYERPSLPHIAYLMANGMKINDAKRLAEGLTGGMFYSFLPPLVECAMLPSLLNGSFKLSLMDGLYAQNFKREYEEVSKIVYNKTSNVFNEIIQPVMTELTGVFLKELERLRHESEYPIPSDAVKIYHLSPFRVGVSFNQGYSPERTLPELVDYLKPVQPFNAESFVFGALF